MAMLDDLTPYYQDRMKYISNQQRKIVDFLADLRRAAPVKEIAKRCFITQQTASSQLKDLRQKGYVKSEEIGRESWYELREPLMRFCLEVKKQRNEPIRLFVDFLRVWYTREELQQRLGLRMADVDFAEKESRFEYRRNLKPIPPDAVMEREYYRRALEEKERNEEDPLLKAYFDEIGNCREQEDDVSALAYAEKLVTSRGEAKDWSEKGRCLNRLERYDEALECLDKAIEIDSNYARAWAYRGDVLDELKRYDEALVSLDKAIELDENDKLAWYWRGYVLNNLKHYEEALVSFDRAIELDENDKSAWVNRGNVLYNLKRYDEALASFDRAIELDENDKLAWDWRGYVLNNLKRYDEALVSYDRAIELGANYEWAWVDRGNVLNNLKRYEEALVSYDKALELDPNYLSALVNRCNVLYNLKRYEEALVSCDRSLELDANYQCAWVLRGCILDKFQRYEEALTSFERAIELDVNNPWPWSNRGCLLGKLGRYEEALISCNKALELDSNYEWAWFSRGWVLGKLGRYEEALISCDKASELGKKVALIFFNRAIALLGLNRWDEGIIALDYEFQHLEPDYEASPEDGDLIISTLFASNYAAITQTRITSLIAVYEKHKYLSILGQGIVRNIPALMSEMVCDKAARTWLELWQQPTSNYEQFQIPIRLLNAAVRYKETKGDRRVLLELPIEERHLLEPLVSGKVE
jgi:tetratricopeptide (TPR) repeat protein